MMNDESQPGTQKPLLSQSEPLREPNNIYQDSGWITLVIRVLMWMFFLTMITAFLWFAFTRPVPFRTK